jgi:hypothetical protein
MDGPSAFGLVAILLFVVFLIAWFFTPYLARSFGYGIGWMIGWVTRRGRARRT